MVKNFEGITKEDFISVVYCKDEDVIEVAFMQEYDSSPYETYRFKDYQISENTEENRAKIKEVFGVDKIEEV